MVTTQKLAVLTEGGIPGTCCTGRTALPPSLSAKSLSLAQNRRTEHHPDTNAGKTVHLANLSFTDLGSCDGGRPVPSLVRVLPDTRGSRVYFPEVHLAAWLSKRFGETPVYAIEHSGARPVRAAYQWLVEALAIDALVLVDGGTDSLMRGDEAGLGTPQEDMASLSAGYAVGGVER